VRARNRKEQEAGAGWTGKCRERGSIPCRQRRTGAGVARIARGAAFKHRDNVQDETTDACESARVPTTAFCVVQMQAKMQASKQAGRQAKSRRDDNFQATSACADDDDDGRDRSG
jgi:hypothetical protein